MGGSGFTRDRQLMPMSKDGWVPWVGVTFVYTPGGCKGVMDIEGEN